MKIHAYIFTYNEGKILPFLLKHYAYVDKITLIDGQSNDNTSEIIKAYPNTNIIQIDSGGEIRDDIHNEVRNTIWKQDKDCDWVFMLDADEFIYCENIIEKLEEIDRQGYTIVRCFGYDMVSETFPEYDKSIVEQVKKGVYDEYVSKPCIWKPSAIEEINVMHGGHVLNNPQGRIKVYHDKDILLLHYNRIGYEYVVEKHRVNRARKSKSDLEQGWGFHHGMLTSEFINKMFDNVYRAKDVFNHKYEYNGNAKVSIITPTYKRIESLQLCIESVLRQSYTNWEMLICNDGDEGIEDLKDLINSYDDKRLLLNYVERTVNTFGAKQRNAMIKIADGEYVMYLDDDNILFNDYIKTMLANIEDMVVCRIIHESAGIIPHKAATEYCDIDSLNIMVKKDLITDLVWDENIYEHDFLFIKEIEKKSPKTTYINEILGRHQKV